ncbi:3-deoxy-7-phosphoheptulonate synthase [Candidatus Woesearchaeota archaeon]|nr:3-deoxy-7-phosphoheptulonate synthase [Candidatus Woesearchaeota archaeon]
MIVVMRNGATEAQIKDVCSMIESCGLEVHLSQGKERTIIGLVGDTRKVQEDRVKSYAGVNEILRVVKPYKLANRVFQPEDTVIEVDGVKIGGNNFTLMAGPCAIESREQLFRAAEEVKKSGAKVLRGSAYKPRTSPYSFQGLGEEGLKLLAEAKQKFGLVVETEVMDTRQVDLVAKYVDIVRVGTRNMQNFDLLKEVGKLNKPVILKRGMSATIKEWLMAAEYIMSEGNKEVILCERGIRTFETETRNSLDMCSIPMIKQLSHLPIIVDPSHSTGKRELVKPMSLASLAAGAHGLIIEVHPCPQEALCDGNQSLTPEMFEDIMVMIRKMAPLMDMVL